jgi:hypothetical protein
MMTKWVQASPAFIQTLPVKPAKKITAHSKEKSS